MKELQELVNQKTQEYFQSGKVEKIIEDRVESMFGEIIGDCFRSYGTLGKAATEVIENKLKLSGEIDIESYNSIMLEALKGQIKNFTNNEALKGFNKVISETFGEAPKEISINEIVEMVLDDWRSDDPCDCDEKTAKIEFKDDSCGSFRCFSLEISDGQKYGAERVRLYFIDEQLRISHKSQMNPTALGGVEGRLYNLYAAGTKVTGLDEFNEDYFDLELGYQHHD